jgi:1-phosphofructokinase family hexose kinase
MKKHIFTITPNPALDLCGVVNNLKPNEKSYVHNEIRSPGGNAINVTRILTRLNVPVIATGFLGGSAGEEIKSLLDQEGVKNKFVKIKGHSRINVTVSNVADHQQTRLTFPGPEISSDEKKSLFDFFENQKNISLLVLGGSLPKGFQPQDVLLLLKLARKRGIPCVVDCPGSVLKKLFDGRPFFIKPNLIEFQEATGSRVKSINGVVKEARKLLNKVPYICVSSVEDGALLVTRKGSYFGKIPKVKIKSTVGAGDSMVAAMTAQFFEKNPFEADILRWGLAAAAATLSHPGAAFGEAQDIQRLYKITKVD